MRQPRPRDGNAADACAPMRCQLVARVSTFLDGATVQAVSGLPPLEGVTGSFVFDAGRLQRSTLTGSWLGGPVTLHVGERREKGTRVLAVQAQGTLNAQQLAHSGKRHRHRGWQHGLEWRVGVPAVRWYRSHLDGACERIPTCSALPAPCLSRSQSDPPLQFPCISK